MSLRSRPAAWWALLVVVLTAAASAGCVTRTPTPHRSAWPEPTLATALPTPSASDTTPSATTPPTTPVVTTTSTGHRATTAAAPQPQPHVPSAAELKRALLASGDLPGFAPSDGGESPSGSGCAAIESDYSGGASATAQVLLSKGSAGPFVRERLNQLSVQAAQSAVSRIRGASSCGRFTADVPGLGKVDVTVSALGVPSIGDGAGGVRLTLRPQAVDVTVYENIVAVRRGGTLILLTHTGVGSIDDALTSTAASRAYDKTKQVW